MKELIFISLLILCSLSIYAGISDVQTKGSWIVVYGDNGRETSRMGTNNKELVGVSGSFFVVQDKSWIIIYNEKCQEISRMGKNNKSVRGAAGSTFTVEDGAWIVTYDKNCREQSRRGK